MYTTFNKLVTLEEKNGNNKKNITTLAYAQQKYNPQQYIYHKEMQPDIHVEGKNKYKLNNETQNTHKNWKGLWI
jgi:hypothetical protein